MEKLFKIEFVPNRTSHRDIELRLYNVERIEVIDSYYLNSMFDNVLTVLKSMLLEWKNSVLKAKKGIPIYLILDFSDQYFGGFCFELVSSTEIKLSYGAILDSHDLNMDTIFYDLKGHEFEKLHEYKTTLHLLLTSIEENIENL